MSINEREEYYFIKDELARGRVEICISGEYGAVCDDNFDDRDASVVCTELGFSQYGVFITEFVFFVSYLETYDVGALFLPTGSFDWELPIVISDVECEGNESSLLDCLVSLPPGECPSREGAAVVCQGRRWHPT